MNNNLCVIVGLTGVVTAVATITNWLSGELLWFFR
jgi:hypothetical protein